MHLRRFLLFPEHLQPSATQGKRQSSAEPKGLVSQQVRAQGIRVGHEHGLGSSSIFPIPSPHIPSHHPSPNSFRYHSLPLAPKHNLVSSVQKGQSQCTCHLLHCTSPQACDRCVLVHASRKQMPGPQGAVLWGHTSWEAASLPWEGSMPEAASHNRGDPNVTTRQGNWQQWDSSESVPAFLPRRGCGQKGPNC